MNKDEVRSIIEATLKSGNKSPGLFDLPKIMRVKSRLESCTSISEVVGVLEDSRNLITKSFGIDDTEFNASMTKLKAQEEA